MTTIDVKAEGRSAREVLAWSRAAVEPTLRAAVDTLPPSMRRIATYHFGWCDEHGQRYMAPKKGTENGKGAGGKAIRPTLALLSAQAVGGAATAAVPAAAAVELVHNFSLVHDDVLDGDLTRRHRRTAWNVFGVKAAILAGDALLTLALDVLAACGHPAATDGTRMLSAAVQALIDGQSADLDLEHRSQVDLLECVSMAEGKTGALIECACVVGAAFGGGSPQQLECLRGFGAHLGLAFQHVDDLLGIWGDPAVTGKPVNSDVRSRKKSLPVVAALTSGTPAGSELAELYQRETPLSDTELAHAADLIDIAGGRDWSQTQVDDLLVQAMRELEAASPNPRAARELGSLARLATHRYS
ncbi:MAG: family 2 encapsulin nanocompartment cargo protein polyprenyl transferase [Pseudonocardiaceae bacterium]